MMNNPSMTKFNLMTKQLDTGYYAVIWCLDFLYDNCIENYEI